MLIYVICKLDYFLLKYLNLFQNFQKFLHDFCMYMKFENYGSAGIYYGALHFAILSALTKIIVIIHYSSTV